MSQRISVIENQMAPFKWSAMNDCRLNWNEQKIETTLQRIKHKANSIDELMNAISFSVILPEMSREYALMNSN